MRSFDFADAPLRMTYYSAYITHPVIPSKPWNLKNTKQQTNKAGI